MKQKKDVQQGTLALMVLKTLDLLGPLHGYGIARRIEQISGDPPRQRCWRVGLFSGTWFDDGDELDSDGTYFLR